MELIPEDRITDDILELCILRNKKGECVGVHHYNVKESICDLLPIMNVGGVLYLYDSGVFIPDHSGTKLKSIITDFIVDKRYVKSGTIRQIHELFFADDSLTVKPEELNDYPKHWIAFSDYLYDCVGNTQHEYKPEYRCINRIPFRHTDVIFSKSGENIDKFLNESMEQDDKETILEYIGYCMSVNCGFEKMVLLKGSGGTGKSTLLHLIEQIVGKENRCSVSLQSLEEKFHAIMLMNKLVNICGDLSSTALKSTGSLKKITGEDTISDSYKGKDIVEFRAYCKLIFSANTLPLVLDSDNTQAFFRRLIIIEMNHKPEKVNTHLREDLEKEIPYLIKISLSAYKRALENGYIFESERCDKLLHKLQKDSDSVSAFVEDACETGIDKRVKKTDLYSMYYSYCEKEERTPVTKHSFNKQMEEKNFLAVSIHGTRYWKGIDIKFVECDTKTPFDLYKNGTE